MDTIGLGFFFYWFPIESTTLACFCRCTLLLGLLLGRALASQSLDDLSLLDQESTHDPVAHASGASRTTIGAADAALTLLQRAGFLGADGAHALEADTTVTAFGTRGLLANVLKSKLATGSLNLTSRVGLGVVAVTTSVSQSLNHCRNWCWQSI